MFFGESLPKRFFETVHDLQDADLLLVLGTSLAVFPFASLVDRVSKDTPRLLINRDPVGPFKYKTHRDVCLLGDCDAGVDKLCELLGWTEELHELERREKEALNKKNSSSL